MDHSSKLNGFYDNAAVKYGIVDFFKNPNKLPINQVYLEWKHFVINKNVDMSIPVKNKECEWDEADDNSINCKSKTDIIPALDKRWLPKCVLFTYEPYNLSENNDDNAQYIELNLNYLETLYHLQNCNFHQFWCTVIHHPQLPRCLASFLQHALPPHQADCLEDKYLKMYRRIYFSFLHVYERLLAFQVSDTEYMSSEFAMKHLVDRKLINLPYVVSLVYLYGNRKDFCNALVQAYFNDVAQIEIHIAETKDIIQHTNLVLQTIENYLNRNSRDMATGSAAALSLLPRPAVFHLPWVCDTVGYLLNTMATMNALLQHYKPAIELALQVDFPCRLPSLYVNIYREFFAMLDGREELMQQQAMAGRTFDEINLGRTEFIDCFHIFVSYCLDKTLENMGNENLQPVHVETCLKLFSIALDEEYFISDYNAKYNVANLLETFESCYDIDKARTEFIINCIARLPRHLKLETVAATCAGLTIEDVFRHFKPVADALANKETDEDERFKVEPSAEGAATNKEESEEVEEKIRYILDMLPHLGDGFVLKCLEYYKYQVDDVINAILENNLPPHLASIPFNIIRIFPEPQPKKPQLAYKGKKPDHKDVMALLNDKSDLQKIRQFILNGAQYEPSEEEDGKIQHVLSEFPRLPYEYVFDCLQQYKFNTTDTINAIRNETLPPHLAPITFAEDLNGKKMKWVPAGHLKQRLRRRQKTYQLDGVPFGTDNVYDDEYDDRFDDNVKINIDRLAITEEDNGAYKTVDPSHWVFKDVSSSSEEEKEEVEEDEGHNRRNRLNFCTDPAVLRAKREAKFGGRSKASANSNNRIPTSSKQAGAIDKQTEINRAKKEVHKSSRANHSRKKGAQWKRNRGMLPS